MPVTRPSAPQSVASGVDGGDFRPAFVEIADFVAITGCLHRLVLRPPHSYAQFELEQVASSKFRQPGNEPERKPFSPTELAAKIGAALRQRLERFRALGGGGLEAGEPDVHGVRGAPLTCGAVTPGADPQCAAAAGVGSGAGWRSLAGAGRGQTAPPQAGGRRRQPQVHSHRAQGGPPHGQRGCGGRRIGAKHRTFSLLAEHCPGKMTPVGKGKGS